MKGNDKPAILDDFHMHPLKTNMRLATAAAYMGSIYFIGPVAYGMNPVFRAVATFIFQHQHPGLGRNVVLMAAFLLPVTTLMKN